MRQLMPPRAARACVTLGAVSAATLALGAHPALAGAHPGLVPGYPALIRTLTHFGAHTPDRRHGPDPLRTAIRRMIAAGNRIARLPYVYGGGHGSFLAGGYDCSGSVSYVLHAAGLLSTPADSSGLESFGVPGPGRHITIYANAGHAWMTIDGRRFDTIALQETGTRWSSTISSGSGYIVRHPAGL